MEVVKMPFQILHNDIINMETDAIVNVENSKLLVGEGVVLQSSKKLGEMNYKKNAHF